MNITINTSKGLFTGRSVDSIVRREFGRGAEVHVNPDPTSPTYGTVVRINRNGQWDVLGTVYTVGPRLGQ